MIAKDVEYWERRAREERQRAEDAADPASAHAHLVMAEEYESRLRNLIGNTEADSQTPGETRWVEPHHATR